METYEQKLNLIKENIKNIDKPTILELGVREGRSTKMFLEVCVLADKVSTQPIQL